MGITKDYMRYVHGGSCGCVGSANGAIAAVDSSVCAVTACECVSFYNMKTTEKVHEVSESSKAVTCLKFSNDKRWMAVGYADGTIRLFDRHAEDAASVVFSGHKKGVNCLAFSNDGLTLASGGKDCTIILWDIVSESGLYRLNGHKESITHLQFTLNDKFIISSSKDTFVKFWSIASQSCFYTLLDSHSEIYSFALLDEDSLMVTASTELELLVFELDWKTTIAEREESSEPIAKKKNSTEEEEQQTIGDMQNRYVSVKLRGKLLRQCKGRALQLAVSPDQRFLACLGADKVMDIYRVFTKDESSKRLTKKMKAAKRKADTGDDATSVNVSEEEVRKDVTILVTRVGDYRTSTKMKWIDFSPAYKMNGNDIQYQVYSLYANNTVHNVKMTVNLTSNAVEAESIGNLDNMGHRNDIRGLSVSASNSAVVSGGGDELIVWNTHSLRPVVSLSDESMKDITCVMYVVGDNHILAGTKTGSIFLWELSSCELLETRKGHEGAVWSLVPLPDKKGFITASADKTLKFWSYELVSEGTRKRLSVREQRVLNLPDEALSCAVSPDGKFVVAGLLDNTAGVYFLDSLKFFVSLYGHSLPVTCCTISPDSKMVVTGSADKSIKIWGLDFGDCHKSFHAHDDFVSCVLFSPSEEMLVWSAGRDGKVKQWDAKKQQRVQVLDRHTAEIRALAQSDTGSLLFSASHDKSIRCWELTEEIIVLEEEEEMEREKEYEERLAEEDDVVPGETNEGEAGLATVKNSQSIVSTENIIDAVDIIRNERVQRAEDPDHKPHPMIGAYNSKSLDHFLVDTISRCRPSNVERALLMVPLSYVADILKCLSACVAKHYKMEFSTRIAIFLIRIHHSYIINSLELLPVIEKLKKEMPAGIADVRNVTGFNLAALEMLRLEIEEAQDVKLFADIGQIEAKTNKKRAKKERKAVIKANA